METRYEASTCLLLLNHNEDALLLTCMAAWGGDSGVIQRELPGKLTTHCNVVKCSMACLEKLMKYKKN